MKNSKLVKVVMGAIISLIVVTMANQVFADNVTDLTNALGNSSSSSNSSSTNNSTNNITSASSRMERLTLNNLYLRTLELHFFIWMQLQGNSGRTGKSAYFQGFTDIFSVSWH